MVAYVSRKTATDLAVDTSATMPHGEVCNVPKKTHFELMPAITTPSVFREHHSGDSQESLIIGNVMFMTNVLSEFRTLSPPFLPVGGVLDVDDEAITCARNYEDERGSMHTASFARGRTLQ
ncbi:hypothetical protein NM688_g8301 [Phlebia brevispora]|uniref:Uncharacterized protein n=1 Tax=Phlebia brevispora TaxID=194682 RepID=A0ACC1RU70_9APHY|nr:hypothetical protein NM688_g8301 [Phlebia brevispora]